MLRARGFFVQDGTTTSLAIFSVLFGEGWGWQKIEFMTLDKIVMARFHGMHLLLGMSFKYQLVSTICDVEFDCFEP